ncbi:hypothetical protein OUZ56_029725 [Daphnia magna]|uniref:Ricin B lectin domain-containing protein n=1 Tax=Daphnia magna TaxID=35525 RepID=A0ABR0B7N0_9CRUS|nr:hypothetical protein OUZ56_029725 [Daphnia magna]
MVNDKKCGDNNMQTGPTGLSFTATPTGEGKWYAIKEYQTLNCIAKQITLRQEKPDSPIESPFGLLNTTQQEGEFIQNQNTIVWGERTTNSSYTQTLLKGKGYLEIPREPESDNSSRLYDTTRQIEISFLNKPDKDIVPIGHKVVGIPLTYLTFPAETTKILYEMFKNTIATCLKNTNLATPVCEDYRELYKSRPQRSLLQQVHFLFVTQVEDEQLRIRLYRVDETLKLEQCASEGDTRKNQQWFLQTINTNPDVIENFPDVTFQDIQEVRLEQRRAVTTTINSPIFGGILKANHGSGNIIWDMIAWGLMKNGQYPNGKSVTHHGLEKQLTMEDCDTYWTKCQDELKTFITSNDPLVQSQVSVGNCSKVTNKGQAFEYTSDFTIRPFNTDACIKANTTMLILQECVNTSSIWGTFEHTGQLMAPDRTGLHSPASDRKCLTLKVGRLNLGHCHGSSRKQHFSFEYRNRHQIRTLSASAIIALHTQQSLDGTQLPLIPPLLKREKDPPVTKDRTIAEDAIMEIIDDTEQTAQQEIPEAASLTLEQVQEVPRKEIRDVYYQLSTIKKTQAVILAQSNGIVAASALGLPICTRLQGFGQAMTFQQCETKRIFISAKESKCGFQPFITYEDKTAQLE